MRRHRNNINTGWHDKEFLYKVFVKEDLHDSFYLLASNNASLRHYKGPFFYEYLRYFFPQKNKFYYRSHSFQTIWGWRKVFRYYFSVPLTPHSSFHPFLYLLNSSIASLIFPSAFRSFLFVRISNSLRSELTATRSLSSPDILHFIPFSSVHESSGNDPSSHFLLYGSTIFSA